MREANWDEIFQKRREDTSPRDDRVAAFTVIAYRDAGAERQAQWGAGIQQRLLVEPGLHSCQCQCGLIGPGVGQQKQELLAAIANNDITGTHGGADNIRDVPQRFIAGLMPVVVIQHLEVIDIEGQQRDAGAGAAGLVHRRGEEAREVAAVVRAGEFIGHRGGAELAVLVAEDEPAGDPVGVAGQFGPGGVHAAERAERAVAVGDLRADERVPRNLFR